MRAKDYFENPIHVGDTVLHSSARSAKLITSKVAAIPSKTCVRLERTYVYKGHRVTRTQKFKSREVINLLKHN